MKIKINGKLPKGFKYQNGTVVRTMEAGGSVNNTLGPIPRDEANLEAEKGETALTDLTNDGSFELYNIGGKRHTEGGTPLNLPEQSFVFSDTRKMNLTSDELKTLGIVSKKKMTPAKASKKFPLNKYIDIIEDETSDRISIATAEDMINKNKIKLSQLAFMQESKKDFSDGLPLAAYPFLIESGMNPQELAAQIEQKNQQGMPTHTMPDGTVHPGATHEEYMAMQNQGALQEFTGGPSMNMGGSPDIAKAIQAQSNPMGAAMTAIKDGTAKNSMNAWLSGDMEGWANAGPAQYGVETSPMTGQPMVPKMGVPEGYVRDQNPLGLPGYQKKGEVPKETIIAKDDTRADGAATSLMGTRIPYKPYMGVNPGTTDFDISGIRIGFYDSQDNPIPPAGASIDGDIQKIWSDRSGEGYTSSDTLYYHIPTGGLEVYTPEEKKLGGSSPFKREALKRFTEGGSLAINQAAQQGRPTDAQIALQNILMYRKELMREYEQTKAYIGENPNILEDPEQAYELQASIQVMEKQLQEIDIQTRSIETKMMQESVQIDPFADPTMPVQQAPQAPTVARYGKELRKLQDGEEFDLNTLTGSDAWGYQGMDEDGLPIIGSSEPTSKKYNPNMAKGLASHAEAFEVMSSADFDPPRKLWIQKYREAAAKNNEGANAWVQGKSDAELFYIFNRMNQYLSAADAAGHTFDEYGAPDDAAAKKYGWGDKAPTQEEIKIFQGMYTSLNNAKIEDKSGLLDQIVTTPMGEHQVYSKKDIERMKKNGTWTNEKAGDNKMVDANGEPVSFVDGYLGWTTGGQFYRADNQQNTDIITTTQEVPCPEDVREKKMKECLEKGQRFDQAICDCAPVTGDWTTPKYPRYETFPQDDLLVATKSAQLAGLEQINPVMEPTLDPMLVNPMYVDPRQELSTLEATAAAAMNANPDQATAIMGALQDQSEKVINKHEALNTKIYNNAQNINIPILNEAAEESADNFKTYMDETNAARENYNVAKMELTDNLVNSVNDQMTNADELYIRNLENPQFWYSPQAHNIEYYNARDLDGKVSSTNPLDQELANYEYLHAQNPDFAKIYYDKMYGKKNDPASGSGVDVTRSSERDDDPAKYGLETKRIKSRKAQLARSKKKLRKWILGYS